MQVIDAGVLTTIQDTGRFGYQAYGIPVSGAMDLFALCAANALVQNPSRAAAIEIHSLVTLATDSPTLIAVTGADVTLKINNRSMPSWTATFVRPGYTMEIAPKYSGGWQYLAIHGGVDVPLVLGSRSTYLRGGFGGMNGRALESDDKIPIGSPQLSDWVASAGKSVSDRVREFVNRDRIVRIVLGPHEDYFTEQAVEALSQGYALTASADRMGYRLQGAPLTRKRSDELISCGVPHGAIQVPADGQPIALMADHQTTGGYPIVATIIGADIPILAQSTQGDTIRFRIVDIDEAQRAWKEMWEMFEAGE